ncbi:MAG: hypothetical protein HOE80_04020 [Candidatus Magasanikbacteria bacterium]|nr:hypothetical protein [Candidatus Magasanikbacteria bacterium]
MKIMIKNKQGMTLMEVTVYVTIFALLAIAISTFFIQAFRSNDIIWTQLTGQQDIRRAMQHIVEDVRKAEQSDIGSFPIESASETSFIFFANIDDDASRERIRFWLDGTTLKKGIIQSSGSPLSYDPLQEVVTIIARDVVNIGESVPLFSYYDDQYTGTEDPLEAPIDVPDIHLVGVILKIDEDPESTPIILTASSKIHIRNVKEN